MYLCVYLLVLRFSQNSLFWSAMKLVLLLEGMTG